MKSFRHILYLTAEIEHIKNHGSSFYKDTIDLSQIPEKYNYLVEEYNRIKSLGYTDFKLKNTELLNSIQKGASAEYQARIPKATSEPKRSLACIPIIIPRTINAP